MDDLRRTALHEAGHAIVMHHLGIPVNFITIIAKGHETGRTDGTCLSDEDWDRLRAAVVDDALLDRAQREIKAHLAGYASLRHFGVDEETCCSCTFMDQTRQAEVSELIVRVKGAKSSKGLLHEVMTMVPFVAHEIRRLAEVLMCEKEMDAARFQRFIGENA